MKIVASVLLKIDQGAEEERLVPSAFHPHIVESKLAIVNRPKYVLPGLEWEPEVMQDTESK